MNTSSVLGKKVRPTVGAYAATKYAIEALSEALRMELSKTDVQISCIRAWPGADRHPRSLGGDPGRTWESQNQLEPDDIARMVLFILEQPQHVRSSPD